MKKLLLLFIFILSISFVVAVPGDWKGEVNISGSAAATGTTVTAYSGSTLLATTTTPTTTAGRTAFGNDFYVLAFEATDGASINFRICGISATNATFSSGTHTLNLSLTKKADGTTGCTCDAVCSGGHCVNPGTTGVCSSNTYYCNSNDVCESAFGETTSTCSADCPSGGGGSSGGGSYTPPTTETTVSTVITTGGTGSFAFTEDHGVTQVDITVKDGVSSSSVTVTESSKPSSAPFAIATSDGDVYKYLEITPTISNSNIKTAKITFRVAKTWVTAGNIDSSTVTLRKLVNNAWVTYTTTPTTEDASYYYYETTVSSFSTYSIVGSHKVAAPSANQTTNVTTTPTTNVTPTPATNVTTPATNETQKPPVTPSKIGNGWYWGIAAIILLAVILYFVFYRKKKA